jgi:hypothetical protein
MTIYGKGFENRLRNYYGFFSNPTMTKGLRVIEVCFGLGNR